MAIKLPENVVEVINDRNAKKVLATVSEKGIPNVAFKGSIHVNEEGNIIVNELLETSQTNKNLTYSLWFDKEVAISVWNDKGVYEVFGIPYRVLVSGPEYEKAYIASEERNPIFDLAGVWTIIPTRYRSQIIADRIAKQKELHPIIGHLDKDRNPDYRPQ